MLEGEGGFGAAARLAEGKAPPGRPSSRRMEKKESKSRQNFKVMIRVRPRSTSR